MTSFNFYLETKGYNDANKLEEQIIQKQSFDVQVELTKESQSFAKESQSLTKLSQKYAITAILVSAVSVLVALGNFWFRVYPYNDDKNVPALSSPPVSSVEPVLSYSPEPNPAPTPSFTPSPKAAPPAMNSQNK